MKKKVLRDYIECRLNIKALATYPLEAFIDIKALREYYRNTFKVMRDADKYYEFIQKLKGE